MPSREEDYLPAAKTEFFRWDERGYIIANGRMELGLIQDLKEAGENIGVGSLDASLFYIEHEEVKDRLVISLPEKLKVAPRELISFGEVSPAEVEIRGPLTVVTQHSGGELKIGFVLPGKYDISFTPFPAQSLSFTIEVA